MRQGRELYLAGKAGSLMVKPLNYFYAITAYAYAIIVLNNPIRISIDSIPSSHGINYTSEGMKTVFGAQQPQGTFSDLFCSFPTLYSQKKEIEIIQDNSESLINFFKFRYSVNVGLLLSMVPEVREYYKMVTGNHGKSHPLYIVFGKDPRNVTWEFQIGDGENRPAQDSIERSFPEFEVKERQGKYIINVPAVDSYKLKACIYTDINGSLWYIENPFKDIILPEICIHFLLTNAFSNLMRYSPDHWGAILLNEINSDWSLMVRKYLSSFENKFPFLILRNISKFYPYIIN